MTEKILRRYTNTKELVDMLKNNRIVLASPRKWEDENDKCLLERFARESNSKSVLLKCFSKAEEAYLMWKAYQNGCGIRICIEFDEDRLLNMIDSSNVELGQVRYKTIKQFQSDSFKLAQLPFIKRYPYRGECEFRMVYSSQDEKVSEKVFQIDNKCITKVLFNPWIKKDDYKCQRNMISNILGDSNLIIIKSSVLSNSSWQNIVDKLTVLPNGK